MGEYTDISNMSTSIPHGTGQLSQADDHMRGIKTAIKNTFPSLVGVVTASTDELNSLVGLDTATDIEERFTELEAYFDYTGTKMTTLQMEMLWDLETNSTVETRINDLEFKTADVSQGELRVLDGYDIFHTPSPYIEDRFVVVETEIGARPSSVSPGVSLWQAYEQILGLSSGNSAWRVDRESILSNTNLPRIASFLGVSFPVGQGYINDLGSDFLLVTQRIQTLEYLVGYGSSPGTITWRTLIANLNGGNGGINVQNADATTESWGFLMVGLEPGTKIDFQFYDSDLNAYGKPASEVTNGSKQILVNESGQVFADIRLGGEGKYGPNDQYLTPGNQGSVNVTAWVRDINGQLATISQTIFCQFF